MSISDRQKKLLVAGLVVVVLALWLFQRARLAPATAAAPDAVAEANIQGQRLESAMRAVLADVHAGRLRDVSRELNQVYPAFAAIAAEHGLWRMENGQTIREWLEGRRRRFAGELVAAWPAIRSGVREGDLAWEDFERFERDLPGPFQVELAAKAREDRRGIEIVRLAGAHGWYLVEIAGASDPDSGLVEVVRMALRRQWRARGGLKLVFDQPMNREEAEAAAHVLHISLQEEFAEYEFGAKGQHRGSGRVPESVTVTVADASRRGLARPPGLPPWDSLPPLMVAIELPRTLAFDPARDRLGADFDRFAGEQRARLRQQLEFELSRWLPAN